MPISAPSNVLNSDPHPIRQGYAVPLRSVGAWPALTMCWRRRGCGDRAQLPVNVLQRCREPQTGTQAVSRRRANCSSVTQATSPGSGTAGPCHVIRKAARLPAVSNGNQPHRPHVFPDVTDITPNPLARISPVWPQCGHGADTESDRQSCPGRQVDPYHACLVHLSEADRAAYLADLEPGGDLDHRGTPLTGELLRELLTAVTDPATHRPRIGTARFDGAQIGGDAVFTRVTIDGDVRLDGAVIGGNAWFDGATIDGVAGFDEASFSGVASFKGATFGSVATFKEVTFGKTSFLGPLVCGKMLDLSEAVFGIAVTIEAATPGLACRRTQWASAAVLRLRYAAVDFSDAVMEYPVTISAKSTPFVTDGKDVPENVLPDGMDTRVQVTSLSGVDAAHLMLTNIGLTSCQFAGTIHLDQLRLEGRCPLAAPPSGLRRRRTLTGLGWPTHRPHGPVRSCLRGDPGAGRRLGLPLGGRCVHHCHGVHGAVRLRGAPGPLAPAAAGLVPQPVIRRRLDHHGGRHVQLPRHRPRHQHPDGGDPAPDPMRTSVAFVLLGGFALVLPLSSHDCWSGQTPAGCSPAAFC